MGQRHVWWEERPSVWEHQPPGAGAGETVCLREIVLFPGGSTSLAKSDFRNKTECLVLKSELSKLSR